MRSFVMGLALAAMVAPASVARDETATSSPMLEKMLSLQIVRSAEMSPDGQYVAFSTFENDFKNDKDMSQLWVVPTSGGVPLQLTHGEDPVGEFEWSADGNWLAFVRKGKLGFMRAAGGEAIMPEFDVKGFHNLSFSPDGSSLYYVSGPGDKALMEAREERYGKYNVVREDGGYQYLWRAALTADMEIDGKPEQLTDGRDYTITGYSLSPDGTQVAFSTWPSPHLADLLKGRIYVMPADGGEPNLIDNSYGSKSTPVWHQSGNTVAYTNGIGFAEYSNIVIRDADGSNTRTLDMPDHDAGLEWFDGNRLLFNAGVRTALGLYEINIDSGNIVPLSDKNIFARSYTFSKDGKAHAFLSAKPASLSEVSVGGSIGSRALTSFSTQLEGTALPTKELITWTSDAGLEIEAVLTKPADYTPGKRYPLYVRTHGGPTGTDRPWMVGAARSIFHPEVLAAEGGGALVLQTNYRGSASYGEAFQTSNLKNLGIGPARDIIAGVKMLEEQGLVDPDRVACLGWSQGGHISAMLATYSDICTAAIMGAGISDWRTYYYNTDITQFTTEYFKATPLADDDVYAKTSPVTYIDNAKTPVLIQHGENDQRVPIANGYQFRQLLLDKGVEARMIVYADMQHGPSKPRTRRAISEHALAWFREYLFGREKAEFVHPLPAKTKDKDDNDEKTDD